MSVPRYLKILIKISLSRLPVPYQVWRRVGIFRAGGMAGPEYARWTFRILTERCGLATPKNGLTVLELGPGDSLLTALFARAWGATRTILIDAAPLASCDVTLFHRAVDLLQQEAPHEAARVADVKRLDRTEDVPAALNATYLTDGLASLRSIPTASVDFAVSRAVLEHVRLRNFAEMMKHLRRVTRAGGVGSHRVGIDDHHLGGALNNLRFSEAIWESEFFARSGFYTNRILFPEMLRIFDEPGFKTEFYDVVRWPALPTPRHKLNARFREFPDEALRVREFSVVLRLATTTS